MIISDLLFIVILIFSIVLHEIAHGWVADRLGDPTARLQERLTLNPLAHLDWVGSVILPLILVFTGAPFIIGWAKPVPFNPYNFKDPKWGAVWVAIAGPLTNIAIAVASAIIIHTIPFGEAGILFFTAVIITNIALAIFNLVPVPPLDGHHILFALIPDRFNHIKLALRQYSFVILIIFVLYGWKFISPLIFWGYNLLV